MDAMNVLMSIAASAWSLAMLLLLALSDTKSRRAALRSATPLSQHWRRTALVAGLLPGVLLLSAGSAVAFLVWSGFVTLAGWGVALSLAPEKPASNDADTR